MQNITAIFDQSIRQCGHLTRIATILQQYINVAPLHIATILDQSANVAI